MPIVLACVQFLFSWLLGCQIAVAARAKNSIEIIGLGSIIGTFWLTFATILVHYYFGFSINKQLIFPILLLSCLFFGYYFPVVLTHIKNVLQTVRSFQKWPLLQKCVVVLISTLIAGSLVQNYMWPVTDWDALALYDFRARVVAETGNFNQGVVLGYFFQYPPYTSLLHTFSYILGFNQAKVWYSLLYASFIISFYAVLKKVATPSAALIGTALLSVSPSIVGHSTIAYTNLSYTLFFSLGILYLISWFKTKDVSSITIGALLVAGSTWVRAEEPFWLVGIVLLLAIATQLGKKRNFSAILLPLAGILLIFWIKTVWPAFVETVVRTMTPQPATDNGSVPLAASSPTSPFVTQFFVITLYVKPLIALGVGGLLIRIKDVLLYLYAYVVPLFAVYVIPLLTVLYSDFKKKVIEWSILVVLVSFLGMIIVGTIVFSGGDASWNQIGGSANRMSMFLIPLFIYCLCSSYTFNQWLKKILK